MRGGDGGADEREREHIERELARDPDIVRAPAAVPEPALGRVLGERQVRKAHSRSPRTVGAVITAPTASARPRRERVDAASPHVPPLVLVLMLALAAAEACACIQAVSQPASQPARRCRVTRAPKVRQPGRRAAALAPVRSGSQRRNVGL